MAAVKLRHLKKDAFLAAFQRTGIILLAAKSAGIDRTTHYDWLESDDDYAEKFIAAREDACDVLEAEALRRATRGQKRLVFHEGKPIMVSDGKGGTVPYEETKHSDLLLIFLLKAWRPEKYRERLDVRTVSQQDVVIRIGDDRSPDENPYAARTLDSKTTQITKTHILAKESPRVNGAKKPRVNRRGKNGK